LPFNFPHNVLVAIVVLSLFGAIVPNLPLNALLARPAPGARAGAVELLATSVTGYAAAHPERRGERRVLIVAYNPPVGLRHFSTALQTLAKGVSRGIEDRVPVTPG